MSTRHKVWRAPSDRAASFIILSLLMLHIVPAHAQQPVEAALTLSQAAALAQRRPPAVLAALVAVERAHADVAVTRGSYWPTLRTDAQATLVRQKRSYDVPGDSVSRGSATNVQWLSETRAEWVGIDFGVRARGVEQAKAQVAIAEADASLRQMSAVRAAAELFVRVLTSERLVTNAELSVTRREAMSRAIARLIEAGMRPRVDLQRAEIEAVAARYGVDVLRASYRADRAALAASLGFSPHAHLTLIEHDSSNLAPGLSLEEATRTALAQRPEIRAQEAVVRAGQAALKQQRARRFPVLGLAAATSYQLNDKIEGDDPDGRTLAATAGAFLRWNALDVVTFRSARTAELALRVERENLSAQDLAARALAAVSLIDAERVSAELEQAEKILEAARSTREAQHKRYELGEASLLELIDAESVEQEARTRRILAVRDQDLARIRALDAAGLLVPRLIP